MPLYSSALGHCASATRTFLNSLNSTGSPQPCGLCTGHSLLSRSLPTQPPTSDFFSSFRSQLKDKLLRENFSDLVSTTTHPVTLHCCIFSPGLLIIWHYHMHAFAYAFSYNMSSIELENVSVWFAILFLENRISPVTQEVLNEHLLDKKITQWVAEEITPF